MNIRVVILAVVLILLGLGISKININGVKTNQVGTEKPTATPEIKKVISLQNYNNVVLEYSTSNGSLPPPYHRDTDITLSKSANGELKGVMTIGDYEKILETKAITFSDDQFKKLVDRALKLESQSGALTGCTGGTSAAVRLSQTGRLLIEVAGNNCGGKTTNSSLKDFTSEIKMLY